MGSTRLLGGGGGGIWKLGKKGLPISGTVACGWGVIKL